MKNNGPVREEKHDTNILKIIFSVTLLIISFLAELYVMINNSDNLVYLLVFGMLIILFAFFLTVTLIQMEYQKQVRKEERYDNIFKSEKASYLLLRNNFEKMTEKMEQLEKNAAVPSEEIINAQKAIAKVSISRSKENADAVLNSNDQVLEKLYALESQINNELIQKEQALFEQSNKDVLAKAQEILSELKTVELSIRNEILNMKSISVSMPGQMAAAPVQVPNVPVSASVQEPVSTVVDAAAETDVTEAIPEEMPIEIPVVAPDMPEEEIISSSLTDDSSILNALDALEGIESELENLDIEEPEITLDEFGIEPEEVSLDLSEESEANSIENIVEEPVAESVDELIAEPVAEPIEEPVSEAAPAVSEDPNHIMTPEEIAALLASTSEPEVVEEPVVEEEKVPMPDLSDPNHIMTPEEIAALLANS